MYSISIIKPQLCFNAIYDYLADYVRFTSYDIDFFRSAEKDTLGDYVLVVNHPQEETRMYTFPGDKLWFREMRKRNMDLDQAEEFLAYKIYETYLQFTTKKICKQPC